MTVRSVPAGGLAFKPAASGLCSEQGVSAAGFDPERFWRLCVTTTVFLAVPFLFVAAVVFAAAVVVAIIAGLFALAGASVLAGLGMASSSILIGLFRRSAGDAFRAFFLQLGVIVGAGGGVSAAALGHWVMGIDLVDPRPWAVGACAGMAGGFAAAWAFNRAWGAALALVLRFSGRKTVRNGG
jgi:hypothetical protein